MALQLVVIHPFAPYAIGDHITDPALVAKYGAERPEMVVRKYLEESVASTPSPASPTVPTLKPIL